MVYELYLNFKNFNIEKKSKLVLSFLPKLKFADIKQILTSRLNKFTLSKSGHFVLFSIFKYFI